MAIQWTAHLAVTLLGPGLLFLGGSLSAQSPAAPSSPPALRILSDSELPPALYPAVDIRWASDGSIYLALTKSGTAEVSLEPLAGKVEKVIPGAREPGGFWGSSRLGASADYLAVAGPAFSLTWRKRTDPLRKEIAFDGIEDIDVEGHRLAVLGARRDDKGRFAPEGAIAWVGSLDQDLTDLRPILLDQRGEGAPNLNACANFELGAIRFLQDGTLLVVPGFQAGAHLYDAGRRLIRTWDTVSLGLDNDCPGLTEEQRASLRAPDPRVAWLNQRRTLEDILPLPGGPGLLIRSVSNNRPTWTLKVLSRNEPGVKTYAVPVSPVNDLSHLRGDVRNGKILLLMRTMDRSFMHNVNTRLLFAELPQGE
jgi:hypothetical protein